MTVRYFAASIALACVAVPAVGQTDVSRPPVAVAQTAMATPLKLSANTAVPLTLNSGLTTKANRTGEQFSLTVAQDVSADGKVVIPKGSRAVGLITYAKGNGSFGKSGKMELAFKFIELNGKQIPLEGTYYQEGQGNTAGTVGAVLAAGIVGGLIVKGHSAELMAGRDFSATVKQDVPFSHSADGSISLDPTYDAGPISLATETEKERKKRLKAEEKARKG